MYETVFIKCWHRKIMATSVFFEAVFNSVMNMHSHVSVKREINIINGKTSMNIIISGHNQTQVLLQQLPLAKHLKSAISKIFYMSLFMMKLLQYLVLSIAQT